MKLGGRVIYRLEDVLAFENQELRDLGEPHRLVTDLDTAFVKQILDIAQRQRKADIEHVRQADDLWAGLEILEWGTMGHA